MLPVSENAIHKHLELSQTLIERMASNSTYCKIWAITLIAALLTLTNPHPPFATMLVPIVLFFLLDAYYLAIERCIRQDYDAFVAKVHMNAVERHEIYQIRPNRKQSYLATATLKAAFTSLSIFPFYLMLFAAITLFQ